MEIYKPCKRCKGKGSYNLPRFSIYPIDIGVPCRKCGGTGRSKKIIGIVKDE